jgi:RNA polymerase sigma-70 factor (ECF subfamily)
MSLAMKNAVPDYWTRYSGELRKYIQKQVSDADAAKDMLQDVFVKVYSSWPQRECEGKQAEKGNVRAWMYKIARHAVVDHYRQKGRYHRAEEIDLPVEDSESSLQEAARYMMPLLSFLPRLYAEPLRLADIDGLAQADIARRLGLGLSATKSRIQRGRQLLRVMYGQCTYTQTDQLGKLIQFRLKPRCQDLKRLIDTPEKILCESCVF